MEHHFNVEIATEYGVAEAILINNLNFWITHNKVNNRHFYDGDYWTYNSVKSFSELFPYLSQRKIQNALKNLVDKKILKTGYYNENSYNRTLWYTFDDLGKSILQNCIIDNAKMQNGNVSFVKSTTDNNTYNKLTDNNTNKIVKEKEKKKSNTELLTQLDTTELSSNLQNILIDWFSYKDERKQFLTERSIKTTINKIKKYSEQYSESKIIDVIEDSIANNWQGIIYEKLEKGGTKNDKDTKVDACQYGINL